MSSGTSKQSIDCNHADPPVSTATRQTPITTSDGSVNAPLSISMAESTRQQQDREFFRKFLQTSAEELDNSPALIKSTASDTDQPKRMNPGDPNSCSTTVVPSAQKATKTNELMNQSDRSILQWPSLYSMQPTYSPFGFDSLYRPLNNSSLDETNAPSSSALLYGNLDLNGPNPGGSFYRPTEGHFSGDQDYDQTSPMERYSDQFDSSRSFLSTVNDLATAPGLREHRRDDKANTISTGRSNHEQSPTGLLTLERDQSLQQKVACLTLLDTNEQPLGTTDINLNDQTDRASRQRATSYQYLNNTPTILFNNYMGSNLNQQSYLTQYHTANTGSPVGHQNSRHRDDALTAGRDAASSSSMSQLSTSGSSHHNLVPTINTTASKRRNKLPFLSTSTYSGDHGQHGLKIGAHSSSVPNNEGAERFSRKVFVGGLPPDIDEEEIKASFRRFGTLVVDWPHKAESKSYFPPKGYAFLLFHEESSVQALIEACFHEHDKLYLCVSSPTIKDKPVQIRPWRLSDTDFVLDSTRALDPRKTVFVGGVPRPLKASELATKMNNLYGGVCYAGIDTDPELKYPKGAGRVAFSNFQSYITAISARFVHIHHGDIEKQVEVKPYMLDDQFCDECQDSRSENKFAPFFCANITCLRYYCDSCWSTVHSQSRKELHKPLVKEGGNRPRGGQSLRW